MTDIVVLNDRINALCDRIEQKQDQYDKLQTVAMTPQEERRLRRLDHQIGLLQIDLEELRERMDVSMAAFRRTRGD